MSDLPRETRPVGSDFSPPPAFASEPPSPSESLDPHSGSSSTSQTGSTMDTAKTEAKQVADTAAEAGRDVATAAKENVKDVAAEARQQAHSLLDTVRTEVSDQAGTQQSRIADALHDLSKELGGMAANSAEPGPLTDLAQQAARKGDEVAHWLQDREPADVLDALRSYGRRHPVTFLALCGLAGVLAGRLTRSAVASRTSLDSHDSGHRDSVSRDDGRREITSSTVTTRPVTDPVTPGRYADDPVTPSRYGGENPTTQPGTPLTDPWDSASGGPLR